MFVDRRDAGRQLAAGLAPLRDEPGLIVLGLPRGGVPVAYEVARAAGRVHRRQVGDAEVQASLADAA